MHGAAGILGWLDGTWLAQAMRGSLWMYPIVETVHIVGFVVLVGSVLMFDMRLFGLSRHLAVDALSRHLLRWSVGALVLVVPAGLMMFSAHPQEFISNPVFILKLTLIMTAGINALIFHTGVYRSVAQWNVDVAPPAAAKLHAMLSALLWIAVISCGRLLAYT